MILRIAGLVLIIFLSSMYHPVHVSVTNMDIDSESGMITVSIKLFSDDFEELIFTKYGRKLEITSQADPGDSIDVVNRYIAEVLKLTINGSDLVELEYDSTELNYEAIWLNYNYKYGAKVKKVDISNLIMLEKYKDQTNLLIISYNDKQNGYRLNNKNTELSLNIK
jgi:hypothetical protein